MMRCARVPCGFSRRRGGRLFPRRRAVDRAAMRPDGNHFGQLAFRRKVAGDVLVVGGHGTKLFAGAFMGIENDDGFSRALLEIVERRDEVGVAGDEYDAVEVGLHVVDEHLGGDIHVGAFLFGFPDSGERDFSAGLAGLFREGITGAKTLVVALDDLKFGAIRRKGGEVNGLTHLCSRFSRVVVDTGREVLDGHDFMFFWTGQEGFCERDNVKPLAMGKTEQPVVQVESVDIYNGLFHRHLSERQRPDSRPALHRIAEAQRSVSNPSRGSARIVPNPAVRNKGANLNNQNEAKL